MEFTNLADGQALQSGIRRVRPIEDQTERERALWMLAFTDGIGELRNPRAQSCGGGGLERRQSPGQSLPFRRRPFAKLRSELQQPRQTVRPFEGLAARPIEVCDLTG